MMKLLKIKPSQKHLIYLDDAVRMTGIKSDDLLQMVDECQFPSAVDCCVKQGCSARWVASEVAEWLESWRFGLRGEALEERTAEILAARNAGLSDIMPDAGSPLDVLKFLFPSKASEFDKNLGYITDIHNRPNQFDSYRLFSVESDLVDAWAGLFRAGRYWVLQLSVFNNSYYFLFEGEKWVH